MMKITLIQDPSEGHESCKIFGVIEYSGYAAKTKCSASVYSAASRKSEAVEQAIKQVDALIRYLEDSKKTLGGI